ncbi:coniferyl aldehyde dehydrogenase [Massilia sp. YIM B04103]|uniref:coniferyl aldehyde dehydrogenase n=1 Tax=Massilia sp. YIM B04103 TaxID=2963106 RepID=UPI00210D27DC|nr:coniferyl aldehyde dehydrogenase [Massilia sp. YIM B04103]
MTDLFERSLEMTMERTLLQQRRAFQKEPPPTIEQRKERLRRLRTMVIAKRAEIEEAINSDFGNRSRHETAIMELMGVVQSIDYLVRKLPRFMRAERRHVHISHRPGRAYVTYQPLGVVGIMAPWNYPFSLSMIPLATAIAAGNRAMIKPSEFTPRTSELIQRMLAVIYPQDEVSVILGGPEVGAAFSSLAFDHLLFTGSTQVGRKIMRAASDNLVPVTLELGGKSPAVIAKGVMGMQTIQSLAYGKLSNAGQTCVAPDYVLVHEDDVGVFVERFKEAVANFYPNGPTHADYTSIVSARHYDRLIGLLEDARDKGAKVMTIGVRPETASQRSRTLAPTLVLNVSDNMAIMDEEIFGPILPIRTYRAMSDVIDYVNARPRPLALYYFGPDDVDSRSLLSRTTSGNVGVNNTLMHVAQDDLPFGGVGPSGMGAYHGIEGFRAMSHAKGIYVQGRWSLARRLHAPFGRFAEFVLSLTLRRIRGA